MSHTTPATPDCDCEAADSIPFLDTSIKIKDGQLVTDLYLYMKPTDQNQYLLPSSCHPAHCTQNIPFSLALRIIRICSEESDRDRRLTELKEMLMLRDYNKNIVNAAIQKALNVPRGEALKQSGRKQTTE